MLELRASSPNLDQWTLRPSQYGAIDLFKIGNAEPQSIISQQLLAQAASAVGRDVKVPVYDSETVTIGSTRSVTIADSENTSQLFTVSFTTYSWGFTHVPSNFMNNELSAQEDWNRKFLKYLYKFASTLEADCISTLSAQKSQVFNDTLSIYSNVANTLVCPLANQDEILGDLSPIMKANDFFGAPYRVLANTGLDSRIQKLEEKSTYNESNKTIQWRDKTFHYTNSLANSAGHKATGYIINPGSVGFVFRHEREALLGTVMPDGTEWKMQNLPLLNLPIDGYYYLARADVSALAGAATADNTRAMKEHYGYAIEIARVYAYNTDLATYPSPIVRFAIADS